MKMCIIKPQRLIQGLNCMHIQSRKHIYVDPRVNSLPVKRSEGKQAISSSCGGAIGQEHCQNVHTTNAAVTLTRSLSHLK